MKSRDLAFVKHLVRDLVSFDQAVMIRGFNVLVEMVKLYWISSDDASCLSLIEEHY